MVDFVGINAASIVTDHRDQPVGSDSSDFHGDVPDLTLLKPMHDGVINELTKDLSNRFRMAVHDQVIGHVCRHAQLPAVQRCNSSLDDTPDKIGQ